MIRYAALARVFQENTPSTISKTDPITPFSPPRLPLSGWTVLVVEDYAINRTIMAHQLRGNGARVLEATDGDSAVARAAEPGLDLILMDIQMPGKDGIAAIREIRALPALDRLPILGFTASADKPTHQRILAAGADGVLTKPLGEVDLIRAVRRATRRHRLTPAIRRDEPGSDD
ncbi:MAG: response regulator [Candidatus Competibacteraceae bacterium]